MVSSNQEVGNQHRSLVVSCLDKVSTSVFEKCLIYDFLLLLQSLCYSGFLSGTEPIEWAHTHSTCTHAFIHINTHTYLHIYTHTYICVDLLYWLKKIWAE